jgi:hypothetical protein
LLAIAASRAIAVSVFEELPHLEDEFANLWEAQVMAGGRIALPSPPDADSFLVPFVVDQGGMRFGKYPPGWPGLLALGAAAGIPYWINPLLAGLAVWLTYRLGSRFGGGGIGVLAAFLTATSPMVLMLSGTLMPHLLTIVLTLAFSLAWFDLFLLPSVPVPRWLLISVAGLSMGLMGLTRPWTAVAVALPFTVHAVLLLIRRPRHAGSAIVAIAAIAGVVGLILPLWQWAQTGNPLTNLYTLYWPYDRIGFGAGIGVLPGGHTLHQAWINTRQSLWAWQHDLFGWPYLSWLFIPAGLLALRRRAEAWIGIGVFVSLVVLHMAYWVGSWLLGPRYFVEAVPFLAAISAGGIAWAGGWIGRRTRAARPRRLAATAAIAVLVTVDALGYLPKRVGGLHGLFGIDRAALSAFEAVHPGRALVIVRRDPIWHGYGNLLPLTEPFSPSELLLAYSRGDEIDSALAEDFPGLPVFVYDPAAPGRLQSLTR